MIKAYQTTQFKRDFKKARQRRKDITKLQKVMSTLLRGEQLDQSYKPHPLKGKWVSSWECHIESDWLLIWSDEDPEQIKFLRTGTHSDLFS